MSKAVHIAYDNIRLPEKYIQNIIGNKSFLEVVYKNKTFLEYTECLLKKSNIEYSMRILNQIEDLTELSTHIINMKDTLFLHLFSYTRIIDPDSFLLTLEKLRYSKIDVVVTHEKTPLLLCFTNAETYNTFLEIKDERVRFHFWQKLGAEQMECPCLGDLSDYVSFITFLTGGFNTRYFNSINETEFTVTKKSANKIKIKSEYTFYHLLPQRMQSWFVLPYDYQETEDGSSYTMERYNIPDMAIRYIHKSITANEMDMFLGRAFTFIMTRVKRAVNKSEGITVAKNQYSDKLTERVKLLKQSREFHTFEAYVRYGTPYKSFDDIIAKYMGLFELISRSDDYLVVGHGDFCFSNILYSNEAMIMRLIDPKGALTEEDLWADPYYDVAKLSHSVCGLYDFFCNGLFEITLDDNLRFNLTIHFNNAEYIALFKDHLTKNGFDYARTRLYEASLFLSMLPLHIDSPHKVFGFLLNAINIMEEVERIWKA